MRELNCCSYPQKLLDRFWWKYQFVLRDIRLVYRVVWTTFEIITSVISNQSQANCPSRSNELIKHEVYVCIHKKNNKKTLNTTVTWQTNKKKREITDGVCVDWTMLWPRLPILISTVGSGRMSDGLAIEVGTTTVTAYRRRTERVLCDVVHLNFHCCWTAPGNPLLSVQIRPSNHRCSWWPSSSTAWVAKSQVHKV